jgi:hypothetical protein
MQGPRGQIAGPVLLVRVGLFVDARVERLERPRAFLVQATLEMAALLLGERHGDLLTVRGRWMTQDIGFARFPHEMIVPMLLASAWTLT